MLNKNVFFTAHAKVRAAERLKIDAEHNSFMFEIKLKEIFNKARRMYNTDDGKIQYETIYNNQKVIFICSMDKNKIIVNTIITC